MTFFQSLGLDIKQRAGTPANTTIGVETTTKPFALPFPFRPGTGIREAGTAGGKTILWIAESKVAVPRLSLRMIAAFFPEVHSK
jgi:hypothetical protein